MKLEELFISEEENIISALEALDKIAKKVLFIVKAKRLIAVLTGGDIRRGILKRGNLNSKVKEMANYSPHYLKNSDKKTAMAYIKENCIEALPIVDDDMQIINVVFWNEESIGDKHELLQLPVVIMAGGKGTRLYPYTKILPKPLIPIGDNPILEIIMDKFYDQGCSEFFLIVNHKKNMIKAYFNEIDKAFTITYADEDIPLGTGGGLSLLKGKINNTFILSNCDILINENFSKILKLHKEKEHLITMVCSVKNFTIPYGVVEIGGGGEIVNMKEKPKLSFFTNTGCYIAEPKVIAELKENQSISFPEIIEKYQAIGEKVGVYPISEQSWMDMGQLNEMEKMCKRLERESSEI